MKKLLTIAAALAMVCSLATVSLAEGVVGKFEVKDAAGGKFNQEMLKKNSQSVIVLVQAACGQCRQELAALIENAETIQKKATLYVDIVDVNSEKALEFFKGQNAPGTLLLNPDFAIGAAVGATATPATIVVDKDLKILKVITGFKRGEFEKLIEEL